MHNIILNKDEYLKSIFLLIIFLIYVIFNITKLIGLTYQVDMTKTTQRRFIMRRRKRIQMKVMMVLGLVALVGPNHLQALIH